MTNLNLFIVDSAESLNKAATMFLGPRVKVEGLSIADLHSASDFDAMQFLEKLRRESVGDRNFFLLHRGVHVEDGATSNTVCVPYYSIRLPDYFERVAFWTEACLCVYKSTPDNNWNEIYEAYYLASIAAEYQGAAQ